MRSRSREGGDLGGLANPTRFSQPGGHVASHLHQDGTTDLDSIFHSGSAGINELVVDISKARGLSEVDVPDPGNSSRQSAVLLTPSFCRIALRMPESRNLNTGFVEFKRLFTIRLNTDGDQHHNRRVEAR